MATLAPTARLARACCARPPPARTPRRRRRIAFLASGRAGRSAPRRAAVARRSGSGRCSAMPRAAGSLASASSKACGRATAKFAPWGIPIASSRTGPTGPVARRGGNRPPGSACSPRRRTMAGRAMVPSSRQASAQRRCRGIAYGASGQSGATAAARVAAASASERARSLPRHFMAAQRARETSGRPRVAMRSLAALRIARCRTGSRGRRARRIAAMASRRARAS
mmetsp:Transcript_36059/g.108983  ORF Transcript_36059/g.108983 Transcript_36059/m.108983 type:complete len:225 (+) Transcript_36059:2679-3353(+)